MSYQIDFNFVVVKANCSKKIRFNTLNIFFNKGNVKLYKNYFPIKIIYI